LSRWTYLHTTDFAEFSYNQSSIWYIVFPQAIRVAIPLMMNSFSSLLKDSSLVSVISITELMRVGNLIYSRASRPFEIYLTLGIFFRDDLLDYPHSQIS